MSFRCYKRRVFFLFFSFFVIRMSRHLIPFVIRVVCCPVLRFPIVNLGYGKGIVHLNLEYEKYSFCDFDIKRTVGHLK